MIPILLIAAGALLYFLSQQKQSQAQSPSTPSTPAPTPSAASASTTASVTTGNLPSPSIFEGMDRQTLRDRFFMYPKSVPAGMKLFTPADNHPEIYAGWAWPDPPTEGKTVFDGLQALGSKLNNDSIVAVLIQIAHDNPPIHKHVLQVLKMEQPLYTNPKLVPIFSAKSLTYPFGYQAERQKLVELGLEECMPRGVAVLRRDKRYVLTFAQRHHFMVFWAVAYIVRFGENVKDEKDAQNKLFSL